MTPWTVALQVPLSLGFPRQEYWSGLPFLPPGGLSNPGIHPEFPVFPSLAGGFFTIEPPRCSAKTKLLLWRRSLKVVVPVWIIYKGCHSGPNIEIHWFSLFEVICSILVFKFFIEVWLIYNIVLISAVQKSNSVICIYQCICHFFFHYGLSQNTEYSSMCCPIGPCCLSILNIPVCIWNLKLQTHLFPTLLPLGDNQSLLYVSDPLPVSQRDSFVSYFRFHI